MLQLVVEGPSRYRKVLTCGVVDQVYTGDIRVITEEMWESNGFGVNVEWDEQEQKLIPKRKAVVDAETEEKRKADVNAEIALKMPDMLRRQLSWADMLLETKAIDDASKVTT